ncbi:DoxX family protein [Aeromicrobium sp. CTD01-1L150]|uniref:DoxX family protein n=1 Tax=Aeromicrobium sp. CTD01-1L150 TaxID=3341830 RepID=UPI0035BEC79F
MNTALWIIAGILAILFMASGVAKTLLPREKIARLGGDFSAWVWDFSPGAVKAIGVLEILGSIGLVLPALLDIAPVLVPLAATGLAAIMVGAAIVMSRRREFKHALVNVLYLSLTAFVAWGRFGPESFTG